jgi:hypothetical protein
MQKLPALVLLCLPATGMQSGLLSLGFAILFFEIEYATCFKTLCRRVKAHH